MTAVGCGTVEVNPSQHSIKQREKCGLDAHRIRGRYPLPSGPRVRLRAQPCRRTNPVIETLSQMPAAAKGSARLKASNGCNILVDARPIASSLKAFGRRPRCKPHRCDRPASDTLHRG